MPDDRCERIESLFQLVDREIWIVTAAGERPGGLVATWVSQASINPATPMVSAGIAVNHHTRSLIDDAGRFGLHLLREDQVAVAMNFAIGSGRDRDKFLDLDWSPSPTGTPILADCLGWLDCRVVARMDGGDRVYYWADVLDGRGHSTARPLTEREFFRLADEDQLEALRTSRDEDIRVQQPMLELWRAERELKDEE